MLDITGEEGSPEGVLNVLHALSSAFDDLFPNVAMEDIISKVYILQTHIIVQKQLNKVVN